VTGGVVLKPKGGLREEKGNAVEQKPGVTGGGGNPVHVAEPRCYEEKRSKKKGNKIKKKKNETT